MFSYIDVMRFTFCAQLCGGVDVRALCSVSLNAAVTHA
jgi:hypothetical protein